MTGPMAITYEDAGVSIDRGNSLVDKIKPLAFATRTPWVLDGVGGFAGLCSIPKGYEEPILVSGTDGVGTKLMVARAMNRHDTIGIDLVAMCVNDVLTTGARPLFFLDYFSCTKLDPDVAAKVVGGIAHGCRLAGCALLGGETAEHPGAGSEGEYDVAGFAVGVADRRALLGAARVKVGDRLLALPSSGVHSNGYSLARRVVAKMGAGYHDRVDGLETTLGEALLTPTRIYSTQMAAVQETLGNDLHAACHVTGGGITENLPRVLPPNTQASVTLPATPAIFEIIMRGGPVELPEMLRTFNMGVGMILVVSGEAASRARSALEALDETVIDLGIVRDGQGSPKVVYTG